MAQANFAYAAPANHAAGLPLALSIFADRAHVRDQIRDDAEVAGFRIGEIGDVALLLSDDGAGGGESSLVPRALGEVVLLDCPQVTGASLAALARLDLRVAHCGAQLVVSTSIEALDDVFGCLDQSNPQILVNPSRAERVMALGRVLARMHNFKVRELSEEDRLTLLRLTEQVSEIALRLERFGDGGPSLVERDGAGGAFRFESPTRSFSAPEADSGERLARATRPALPDPRLVRRIIRQRQLRARFFDGDLFADPAWDLLLDLTAARVEHT